MQVEVEVALVDKAAEGQVVVVAVVRAVQQVLEQMALQIPAVVVVLVVLLTVGVVHGNKLATAALVL
jgi:flagellar biosynthesis protein FliQ